MLAMCQGSSHVVRLEGLYEDDEQAYIVMELCEGGDLRSMLQVGQGKAACMECWAGACSTPSRPLAMR